MSVWTHAEEDEIELGQLDRVLADELGDQLLLVRVCHLLHVICKRRIDGMNVLVWYFDFGEELLLAEFMIRVCMIEWDGTFVGVEDMPEYKLCSLGRCVTGL